MCSAKKIITIKINGLKEHMLKVKENPQEVRWR